MPIFSVGCPEMLRVLSFHEHAMPKALEAIGTMSEDDFMLVTDEIKRLARRRRRSNSGLTG